MKGIATLFLTAALALSVAAQDTNPDASASVNTLRVSYLKALEGKVPTSEPLPVQVGRRADLPDEDALALTVIHFVYDENAFNYAHIRGIVRTFAADNAVALERAKIKYLGVANKEGRGVWLDLSMPGMISKYQPKGVAPAVTQPSPAAPTEEVGTPTYYPGSSRTVYTGPRGGRYTYSSSGKKVYIKRK